MYFDEYNELPDDKMEPKYDPNNLFLETYNYVDWFENEELTDTTRKSDKEKFVDLSD